MNRNEYYKLKRREYRARNRADNRCIMCGKTPRPGRSRCSECIKTANKRSHGYMKDNRVKAKEKGECIRCFHKLGEEDKGMVKCLNCRQGVQ